MRTSGFRLARSFDSERRLSDVRDCRDLRRADDRAGLAFWKGRISAASPMTSPVGPISQAPLALALKSGNFGTVDFFQKAFAHWDQEPLDPKFRY
jgi:hypothetical protein